MSDVSLYNKKQRLEVYQEEISSDEVVSKFNAVLIMSRKGELIDVIINTPLTVGEIEPLSRTLALTVALADNVAKYLSSSEVKEIDLVLEKAFVVVLPENTHIRIAISSSI